MEMGEARQGSSRVGQTTRQTGKIIHKYFSSMYERTKIFKK